jgi:Cof subfamily protein (haloacid dehalogenase superfamily)
MASFLDSFRLAAIDLDGTLLGPEKTISSKNREAIALLQSKNIAIVLATGRRSITARLFQEQLGVSGPLIACNGAYIEDTQTCTILHAAYLAEATVAQILTRGEHLGMRQVASGLSGKMFERENHLWVRRYAPKCAEPEDTEDVIRHQFGEKLLKIDWYKDNKGSEDGDETLISSLYEDYVAWAATPEIHLATTRSSPHNIEFMAHGTNKADGVARVCTALQLPQGAVLAFGDNDNDAPMLAWAGCGVAMSHGNQIAKASAKITGPIATQEDAFAASVFHLAGL